MATTTVISQKGLDWVNSSAGKELTAADVVAMDLLIRGKSLTKVTKNQLSKILEKLMAWAYFKTSGKVTDKEILELNKQFNEIVAKKKLEHGESSGESTEMEDDDDEKDDTNTKEEGKKKQ